MTWSTRLFGRLWGSPPFGPLTPATPWANGAVRRCGGVTAWLCRCGRCFAGGAGGGFVTCLADRTTVSRHPALPLEGWRRQHSLPSVLDVARLGLRILKPETPTGRAQQHLS